MSQTRTAEMAQHTEVLRISERFGQYSRFFGRKPKTIRWNEYEPY